MQKEDFSHLMKDYTCITSIFVKGDNIILSKTRFGIKFLEEHKSENLANLINKPKYIC